MDAVAVNMERLRAVPREEYAFCRAAMYAEGIAVGSYVDIMYLWPGAGVVAARFQRVYQRIRVVMYRFNLNPTAQRVVSLFLEVSVVGGACRVAAVTH